MFRALLRGAYATTIDNTTTTAYRMLGLITQNFKYLTTKSFTLSYKNMVRSQLDYCSSVVWSLYRKGDIEALVKAQKKATKILPQ